MSSDFYCGIYVNGGSLALLRHTASRMAGKLDKVEAAKEKDGFEKGEERSANEKQAESIAIFLCKWVSMHIRRTY